MNGLLVIFFLFLCTAVQEGATIRHMVTSDLCQPCAGSTRSSRQGSLLPESGGTGNICYHISDFTSTIFDIRYNVRIQLFQLVSDIFDGDVSSLEMSYLQRQPGQCSIGPLVTGNSTGRSQMSSMYSQLADLHLLLNFTESHHPWNRACSVGISGISDSLNQAMCDLHFMVRGSSQTQGFDTVCQKDGCYSVRRHCVDYQEHSYMALRYASDVLDTITSDIVHLKREWGC